MMDMPYLYALIKRTFKEKISKLKQKFEKFKYDKNNPNHGLKIFESLMVSRFVIVSQSFEDYMIGKKVFKRRVIAWSFNLLLWIIMFRSLISALLKNKYYEEITGGIHYLYFRPDLLGFMVSLLFAIITPIGLVIFIL
jgi:hypothetical protein